MQGVVFDIKRGGVKDGPGFRTSVFLKGCPLRCIWCHNPESQAAEIQRAVTTDEVCGREMSVDEVMGEVLRDAVFYRTSGGGVTFTGGEPMFQFEFLKALCAAARAAGVHVAVDTSGYAPWERFAELLPLVDLFLYDLKCMDRMTSSSRISAASTRRARSSGSGVRSCPASTTLTPTSPRSGRSPPPFATWRSWRSAPTIRSASRSAPRSASRRAMRRRRCPPPPTSPAGVSCCAADVKKMSPRASVFHFSVLYLQPSMTGRAL